MKKAAFSVFVDALILLAIGSILMLFPSQFLGLLRFQVGFDLVIARTLGLLVIVLSLYYMLIGRTNLRPLVIFTVVGRLIFFLGTVVFFIIGWSGPNIFLISALDLVGPIWTLWALRADKAISNRYQ